MGLREVVMRAWGSDVRVGSVMVEYKRR
jgi:hypothetical protein